MTKTAWDAVRTARAITRSAMVEGKRVETDVRCAACGRRLAEYVAAPYAFRCPRCKSDVRSASGLTPSTEEP